MAQYIDKDALVAEIDRQIKLAKFKAQQAQENNDYESYLGWSEHFATCGDILKIIDTIEVKEVDLEKEVNNWRHKHFYGRRDKEADGEYLERVSQLNLAKHFFELGMNTSKGKQ